MQAQSQEDVKNGILLEKSIHSVFDERWVVLIHVWVDYVASLLAYDALPSDAESLPQCRRHTACYDTWCSAYI
jgi:hypothetical protein